MKKNTLFFMGLTFLLISCVNDEKINKYYKIITDADKFKIYTLNDNSSVKKKEITDYKELVTLKEIFTDKIKAGYEIQSTPYLKIEIYRRDKLQGILTCLKDTKFASANFQCPEFTFGFQLTYKIGMYISDM